MNALLGQGPVRHQRLAPHRHGFAYPACFFLLPLRRLREQPDPVLPRNRRAWMSFHDADHGEGGPDALAWAEGLLQREGLLQALDGGELWLQCFPRVAGHAFKPVSFWYGLRADGSLALVLAEVHNTFGEKHVYLLQGDGLASGAEVQARKVFHVSPFAEVAGRYRFRFFLRLQGEAPRSLARVDLDDADGHPLLQTSLSGLLQPLSHRALRRAALAQPLHSLMVVARIHWHALRLWLKRVPWFSKPDAPLHPLTRSTSS
ncbi:MAG: DUF1365 domain-containing protein [Burkholderiales bacterium]|nr:DUF1365 domain-containing protein [Burkholderiales bacterium]